MKIGDFAPTGPVDPKFSSSQQTRLNGLSYDIKIWTDLSTILSQSTRLTDRQTDRQTDRRAEFSSLDRVCMPCSAVTKVENAKRNRPNRNRSVEIIGTGLTGS